MDFHTVTKYSFWLLAGIVAYGAELPPLPGPEQGFAVNDAGETNEAVTNTPEAEYNPECVPDHTQIHDIGAVFGQPHQGAESHHTGHCPPAPDELMREACDVCMCWSDSQCGPDQKCCYNGCMQTCLHKVKPPPVLDWLIEPTRKPLVKGNSWLIPGPEIVDIEETCSTSIQPDGESPLPCPTGYICNIQDLGDPLQGVPNRGVCQEEE